MAEKRYYWLKLKEDYFNSPKIKKLRKIAGGDTYTIIYLKMQLLSIKNNGIIEFEKIEPTFQEELALKLDEDVENVSVTLTYLQTQGLIDMNENNEFLLLEASNNIGSESESAERVRQFRERENQKALQCNGSVTGVLQNSISISNSKSISNSSINKDGVVGEEKKLKHKYGEYKRVLLTDEELEKLNNEFGEAETQKAITYLDEYIEMKGAKYKSHYLVMKKWVYEAIKERAKPANNNNKSSSSKIPYNNSGYTDEELKEIESSGRMYGLCIE